MASLTHRSGRWVLSFYTADKRKRSLWLGEMTKRTASTAKRHIEELVRAQKTNLRPEADTEIWIQGLEGRLRAAIANVGLCDATEARLQGDERRLLGPFLDAYIVSRTDCKPNTISNFKQARRELCAYFGEDRPLRAINAADGERWRRSMLAKPLAVATVSKHVKRAKTMLAEAVLDELLDESPFAALKGGNESNPARLRIISRETSQAVLDACPGAEWRLIFALARFGGLRIPSEIAGLRWTDVDWAGGRLRIDSPKTGLRYCPLFPELRAAFEESWELAADGAELCLDRYRHSDNLRTQFQRILRVAGIPDWPKLFQNLRATRRTELQEQFPSHVINEWLGQSTKVAERHYLQVTDEHWVKAASLPAAASQCSTGASISARLGASGATTEPQKALVSAGFAGETIEQKYPRKDSNLGPAD